MLVKAKWNVKDSAGWHVAGEVFNTEADLGDAVEVIEGKKTEPVAEKPEKEESAKEEVKTRASGRRKISK